MNDLVEPLLTGAVTLASVFVGAWYAFRLSDNSQARATTREQVAAMNWAQFVLFQHLNKLITVRDQFIEPFRNHPLRHVAMRPLMHAPVAAPGIDFPKLQFLLETPDRNLLFQLTVEIQRIETAFRGMDERSRLHREKVQPAVQAVAVDEAQQVSEAELRQVLGPALDVEMRRLTHSVIEHFDEAIISVRALSETFFSAAKARFPKHHIIRLERHQPRN